MGGALLLDSVVCAIATSCVSAGLVGVADVRSKVVAPLMLALLSLRLQGHICQLDYLFWLCSFKMGGAL